LPIPEELRIKKFKKDFTKKEIVIAKMVSIKSELESIHPGEFKQLTDLPHNEESFDQIIK
jgi:hypothetical protein